MEDVPNVHILYRYGLQAALNTIPPRLFGSSSRATHLTLQVFEALHHVFFVIGDFGRMTADSNSFAELSASCLNFFAKIQRRSSLLYTCVPLGIATGGGQTKPLVLRAKQVH
ncbi:hypothetical protein JOM56_004826 [Amanita muscaria]